MNSQHKIFYTVCDNGVETTVGPLFVDIFQLSDDVLTLTAFYPSQYDGIPVIETWHIAGVVSLLVD